MPDSKMSENGNIQLALFGVLCIFCLGFFGFGVFLLTSLQISNESISQLNEKYTAFCNSHNLSYDTTAVFEECYRWIDGYKVLYQFRCNYEKKQIGFILPYTDVKVKECFFIKEGGVI